MATMPSRIDSFRIALPHILPQVDRLFIYLDKYESIPHEIASNPKIISVLGGVDGKSLGSCGKLSAFKTHPGPCLFFGFDDDIIYPEGYVNHMDVAMRRYHYRSLVGVHGIIYKTPLNSYVQDRHVLHFRNGLQFDTLVDGLGSGTIAFHSNCIQLDPDLWVHHNMTDLSIMTEALHQKVSRICIRRRPNFLQTIHENQDDSIYRRVKSDDSVETRLIQAAMRHYPSDWRTSS